MLTAEAIEKILYKLQDLCIKQNINLLKDIKKVKRNNLEFTCPIHKNGMESNPSCGILLTNVLNKNGKQVPKGTVHCFTCGYKSSFEDFLFLFFQNKNQVKLFIKGYTAYVRRPPININLNVQENKNLMLCNEDLTKYEYYHPYMYRRKLTTKVIDAFEVGYDSTTNSITFPIRNKYGKLIMVQRRSVTGKSFDNGYNSMKGSILYGEYMIYKLQKKRKKILNEIWITESPIDCLTLWAHNIPAIALLGCRATKYQLELLKQLPTRNLVLALDNDEAGSLGMNYIAKNIKSKLIYKIKYPTNIKDINEADITTLEKKLYYFI